MSDQRTPPGQIIDGDLEEQATASSIQAALELQGLSTHLLLDRKIVRVMTTGTDAIFAVEFDDGSRCRFHMLGYDPAPGIKVTVDGSVIKDNQVFPLK